MAGQSRRSSTGCNGTAASRTPRCTGSSTAGSAPAWWSPPATRRPRSRRWLRRARPAGRWARSATAAAAKRAVLLRSESNRARDRGAKFVLRAFAQRVDHEGIAHRAQPGDLPLGQLPAGGDGGGTELVERGGPFQVIPGLAVTDTSDRGQARDQVSARALRPHLLPQAGRRLRIRYTLHAPVTFGAAPQ